MDSQWFRKHTESLEGKGNNPKKKILIILPIIFLLLAGMALAAGRQKLN